MIGAYKIETQVISGTGKFERTGLGSDREAKKYRDSLQVLQSKQQKYKRKYKCYHKGLFDACTRYTWSRDDF